MVIRYKPGSCRNRTEVFTNQRRLKKKQGSFLVHLAPCSFALATALCSECVMSVRFCEAVPCPPAGREGGLAGVYASTHRPAVNGQHEDGLIHPSDKQGTETLDLKGMSLTLISFLGKISAATTNSL